jgi:hypothetical protein
LFNSGTPEDSFNFNESRVSLGLGRLSIDGMRVVSRPSIGQLSLIYLASLLPDGVSQKFESLGRIGNFFSEPCLKEKKNNTK